MKRVYIALLGFGLLKAAATVTVSEIVNNLNFNGIESLGKIVSQLNSDFQKNGHKRVNDQQALDLLLKREGLVLLKFYANWCGPCRNWAPIVSTVAQENKTFKKGDKDIKTLYIEINVDFHRSISRKFSITNIPASVIYVDGIQKQKSTGLTDKNTLVNRLKQALGINISAHPERS